MLIDGEIIINQNFWDSLKPDAQDAMKKSGPVTVLSEIEWAELGKKLVEKAQGMKKVTVKYAQLFGELKGPRQYEITIPSKGDAKEDCETVFRYMNHVDGDADGVEQQLIAIKERSMSAGDSVIIDGSEYLCMLMGFKKLTDLYPAN